MVLLEVSRYVRKLTGISGKWCPGSISNWIKDWAHVIAHAKIYQVAIMQTLVSGQR